MFLLRLVFVSFENVLWKKMLFGLPHLSPAKTNYVSQPCKKNNLTKKERGTETLQHLMVARTCSGPMFASYSQSQRLVKPSGMGALQQLRRTGTGPGWPLETQLVLEGSITAPFLSR